MRNALTIIALAVLYITALANCTETKPPNLNNAEEYYKRGIEYSNKGKARGTYSPYKALEYKIKKDYDQAISDFTEAIRLNPNDDEAYYSRGEAYYDMGDYKKATSDYNEAVRLNPNFEKLYYGCLVGGDHLPNEANALKIHYNKYISQYTEAIKTNPNDAEMYGKRAFLYYEKGDYDLAISDYDEAIRLNPNYAEAYNDRGRLYVIKKKDWNQALADYGAAHRIAPSNPVYIKNLEYARKKVNP